eukprot:gi/632972021/ref/XP_007902455.1/ PREDICTED: peflin isoform X1 [Callorhinchus milii]
MEGRLWEPVWRPTGEWSLRNSRGAIWQPGPGGTVPHSSARALCSLCSRRSLRGLGSRGPVWKCVFSEILRRLSTRRSLRRTDVWDSTARTIRIRGPSAVGVPAGVDPEAYSWFHSVDADSSGYISMKELKQALVNTNWSTFNDETCYLMINMFDKNKMGKIDVYGFSALWRFLQQWRNMFQQFDRDRSGSINAQELQQALSQMGYNLSPQFTQFLVSRFAQRPTQPTVQLDSFIHICTQLQSTSEAFREKDTSRSGNIRVSYEDFLTLAVSRML